jgi:hypothetical protein
LGFLLCFIAGHGATSEMVRFSHHDMGFVVFCRIARRYASLRTTTKSHVMLTGGGISPYGSVIAKHLTLHRKTTKIYVMLTEGSISLYGIVLRGFTTFHCRA